MAANNTVSDDGSFDLSDLYEQLRNLDRSEQELQKQQLDLRKSLRSSSGLNDSESGSDEASDCDTAANDEVNDATNDAANDIISTISSVQQTIDDVRSSIRHLINTQSLAKIRRLTILSLPDEILKLICECFDRYSRDGLTMVKQLRLTCRRICSASSHLLLSSITVGLSYSSLSHLEEVSGHPTICKGVLHVKVALDFYSPVLAAKFESFDEHCRSRFDPQPVVWGRFQGYHEPLVLGPLQDAYKNYRRGFEEQNDLLTTGAFVRRVAASVSKMPRATNLQIGDKNVGRNTSNPGGLRLISRPVLFPPHWHEALDYNLGLPPTELLVKLPAAIYRAGTSLTSFDIGIQYLHDPSSLMLSQQDYHDFAASVQKLKSFTCLFAYEDCENVERELASEDVEHVNNFFSPIISAGTLEELKLRMNGVWRGGRTVPLRFGHSFRIQNMQKLDLLILEAIAFDYSDLKEFLDQLDKPLAHLGLEIVHLLSGSWVDVLEILRASTRKGWGSWITLRKPRGAEMDEMTPETYRHIFEPSPAYNESIAELYIREEIAKNPLIELPEGEEYSNEIWLTF